MEGPSELLAEGVAAGSGVVPGPEAIRHGGSECRAGNPNRYVNLYFLRSAKQIIENDANSEGQEKIVPSFIASHIYRQELVHNSLRSF